MECPLDIWQCAKLFKCYFMYFPQIPWDVGIAFVFV